MKNIELKDLKEMKGFSIARYFYQDKNKLDSAVRELLIEKSNVILDEDGDMIRLVDEVIDGVTNLNNKFVKCKSLNVWFDYMDDGKGIVLRGASGVFEIHFCKDSIEKI